MSMHEARAPAEHKAHAPRSLAFALLTVSDSRTARSDASGDAIARFAKDAGHEVVSRALVRDEPADILASIHAALDDARVDVVVSTGGTGVAPRDVTIETVRPLFEKELPGFGETFRALSFAEIGSAAIGSRATLGVARGKLVALLPGSPHACELAMARLLLPEAPHLVGLLRR